MNSETSFKKSKTYCFHTEWEQDFFFTMSKSNCICLICHAKVALPKKGNVQRHFKTVHSKYDIEFPCKSELRKHKVRELKSCLASQQMVLTKPSLKSKAATIASFRLSHILAKHKKPFQDGELIKEAFLVAADVLFQQGFKNKSEIISAIKDVQLSRNTVTRRCEVMAQDVMAQLKKGIAQCEFFSLQFDESTDMSDTSQMCIFIRMVFKDLSTKEDFLKILPLKGKTRGEDIFQIFKQFVKDTNLPVYKLVSMTTDGAPAMTGRNNGFIALCRKDQIFPDFLHYHCIIHQQALCGKMLNMKDVMDITLKIVYSIRAKSLQRRLFRSQLQENEAEHADLLLHTDVRWLSRGKFLQRFRDLLPEIKEFLVSKETEYKQLDDEVWLLDLAFLTDVTVMLNDLNLDLQGQDKSVSEMIGAVQGFKKKLHLISGQLQHYQLRNFKNMSSELENQKKKHTEFETGRYLEQIGNIICDFDRRFKDFALLEPVATFMCFPFTTHVDVGEISSQIASLFHMDISAVENEIVTLQSDIRLKAWALEGSFYNLISEEKYPYIRKCIVCLSAFFGSTYLCESAFSNMKLIKSKFRYLLTDDHLDACLRLGLSSFVPDYARLADLMQCKASTSEYVG